MKRKSSSSKAGHDRSAEQPAGGAPDGSAEQPAHDDHKRRKTESKDKLMASVSYLVFPAKDFDVPEERHHAIEAVKTSKDSGVSVINIIFSREDDLDSMWSDLEKEIPRQSSAAQAAFSYRVEGSLLTIFSENCGSHDFWDATIDTEGGVPAICLTFDTSAGRICTINAAFDGLPRSTRKRLLDEYLREAAGPGNSVDIIGGFLGNAVALDSLVRSLNVRREIAAHGDICVLAKSRQEGCECLCSPVDHETADAVAVQIWQKHVFAADGDVHPVAPTQRTCKRKRKARAVSDSDVHPAAVQPKARKQNVTDGTRDSDGHPAQRSLVTPCPLWDKFVEKLDMTASGSEGQQLMQFIQEKCFFGDLRYKKASGEWLEKPMSLAIKMECLLHCLLYTSPSPRDRG